MIPPARAPFRPRSALLRASMMLSSTVCLWRRTLSSSHSTYAIGSAYHTPAARYWLDALPKTGECDEMPLTLPLIDH